MLVVAGILLALAFIPSVDADAACEPRIQGSDVAVYCAGQTVGDPFGGEYQTEEFCLGDTDLCDQ